MNAHSGAVAAAIAAAASYLSDARSSDLLWRDFETLAGEGCDWVSGFVAYAAGASGTLREPVRDCTRVLLHRQHRSGGWAFNERVPPDCDSTAWVLLAMATTTVWKPSTVLRALNYVLRHATDGGFVTYATEDGIDRFIGAAHMQTKGWRGMHVCVTAAATHALLVHGLANDERVRAATAALRGAQQADGLWRSYWWRSFGYATAQTLRTLAAAKELDRPIWRRAVDGLLEMQCRDGGFGDDKGSSHAFATAMALTALLTRPDPRCDDAISDAARWLLERQHGGRWGGVPILRIPRPMIAEPEAEPLRADALGTGVIVSDRRGIFTTAACLSALTEYRLSSHRVRVTSSVPVSVEQERTVLATE